MTYVGTIDDDEGCISVCVARHCTIVVSLTYHLSCWYCKRCFLCSRNSTACTIITLYTNGCWPQHGGAMCIAVHYDDGAPERAHSALWHIWAVPMGCSTSEHSTQNFYLITKLVATAVLHQLVMVLQDSMTFMMIHELFAMTAECALRAPVSHW